MSNQASEVKQAIHRYVDSQISTLQNLGDEAELNLAEAALEAGLIPYGTREQIKESYEGLHHSLRYEIKDIVKDRVEYPWHSWVYFSNYMDDKVVMDMRLMNRLNPPKMNIKQNPPVVKFLIGATLVASLVTIIFWMQ